MLYRASSTIFTTRANWKKCPTCCPREDSRWGVIHVHAFFRGQPKSNTNKETPGHNPLILTIQGMTQTPFSKGKNSFYLVLGIDLPGTDPKGLIKINLVNAPIQITSTPKDVPTSPINPKIQYLSDLTLEDKLALETGYQDRNEWLEWMYYTARQHNQSGCIACATARPQLGTSPFRLDPQAGLQGLQCVLRLYKPNSDNSSLCTTMAQLFPKVTLDVLSGAPPSIAPLKGNYTCFELTSAYGINVQTFPPGYCSTSLNITTNHTNFHREWFINHSQSRADLWWMCGDMKLRPKLPKYWTGQCALIQLVMPFKMFPAGDFSNLDQLIKDHPWHRAKRSITPGGSFDNMIYIDAIEVTRGVPDEFKARNQIGAGFESFLAWWVTINKNVDWINYIYYNQQRFINYTRDAVKGIAEQLGPTSLMTWQNRIALDMLLSKEGGVCKMIGIHCCTFIPNNTAPDGSITRALEGLTALSAELAENSGINDPFSDLLSHWFGKWSGLIMSSLVSVALFAAILVLCGCCCIPCIRQLCANCITRAIDSKYPPPYQLSQLATESVPQLIIYDNTLDPEDKQGTSY
uniref:Envelope polyprotein n=1 Tax=Monopterus albus TaxID=43700 RepID=A0A3Q3K018_MONAL